MGAVQGHRVQGYHGFELLFGIRGVSWAKLVVASPRRLVGQSEGHDVIAGGIGVASPVASRGDDDELAPVLAHLVGHRHRVGGGGKPNLPEFLTGREVVCAKGAFESCADEDQSARSHAGPAGAGYSLDPPEREGGDIT